MHAIWTLPSGDTDFSIRWSLIKRGFSASMPKSERRSASRAGKGERGIWQRRFWEHAIRDERDFATHVDYIHFNAVKHGLVQNASHWPFSSFHRAVARGEYARGWSEECGTPAGYGERR
jgi:putative transposase